MAEKSSPRVRWDAATRHAANPRIEEPDAGIPHVRIRGGPGAVTPWVYPRPSSADLASDTARPRIKLGHLRAAARRVEHRAYAADERVDGEGLVDHGRVGQVGVVLVARVARHEQDAHRRLERGEAPGQRGPAHPRHHHVAQHQIDGAVLLAEQQGLAAVRRREDRVAGRDEDELRLEAAVPVALNGFLQGISVKETQDYGEKI